MGCVVKFKIGNILFSDSVGIWEIFEFGIEIFEVFFFEFGIWTYGVCGKI